VKKWNLKLSQEPGKKSKKWEIPIGNLIKDQEFVNLQLIPSS